MFLAHGKLAVSATHNYFMIGLWRVTSCVLLLLLLLLLPAMPKAGMIRGTGVSLHTNPDLSSPVEVLCTAGLGHGEPEPNWQ